jgi:hypothetical protein
MPSLTSDLRPVISSYFNPSNPNARIAAAAKKTLSSAMWEKTVTTFDILVASKGAARDRGSHALLLNRSAAWGSRLRDKAAAEGRNK